MDVDDEGVSHIDEIDTRLLIFHRWAYKCLRGAYIRKRYINKTKSVYMCEDSADRLICQCDRRKESPSPPFNFAVIYIFFFDSVVVVVSSPLMGPRGNVIPNTVPPA